MMNDYKNVVAEKCVECFCWALKIFLIKRKQPRTFYQYSTISAFKGVIEGNNLWATHWAYLNDAKELKRGIEIAHIVFARIKQIERFSSNSDYFSVLEKYVSKLDSSIPFNVDVYVLCFSEVKDRLSLWRGYGNGYNSVVIGYDADDLEINENNFGLPLIGKVIYNEDEQKKMMLMYLVRYYEMIEELHKIFPKQKREIEKIMKRFFLVGILILSLFIKEKCWKEEKEWRMIFLNPDIDFLDFKVTDNGLIPFIKVPIFKDHAIKCIKNVCLPKSSNFALREKAVKMLWNKFCNKNDIKKDLKVKESSISIVY